MFRSMAFLFVVPLLMCAGGCSIYLDQYRFAPRPGFVEIPATQPAQQPPVTAFATIVGVRRDDSDNHIPASVEVRMRVQNNGPRTVVFDPRSLELMNGELMKFSPPLLHGEPVAALAPLTSMTVNTFFPFPPGYSADNTDLESLQLQWLVKVDDRPVSLVVNFHRWFAREYYDPYGPYWDYPPPVTFGLFGPRVVFVHRF